MQKILIAFMATVSLAALGCKKKSADGGDMMAMMTEHKNKMCECKAGDKACADKVNEDMRKMNEQHAKSGQHAADPEMAKKMEPISRELGECMMKAMAPAGGDPAGSAAGSAMGSDHAAMGHGSGSAMGSDHAAMGHGSGSAKAPINAGPGSGSSMGSGSAAGSGHDSHK